MNRQICVSLSLTFSSLLATHLFWVFSLLCLCNIISKFIERKLSSFLSFPIFYFSIVGHFPHTISNLIGQTCHLVLFCDFKRHFGLPQRWRRGLPERLECLCLWIRFSSSELWDEEDGSTSDTPESAGLGGSEPAKQKIINYEHLQSAKRRGR